MYPSGTYKKWFQHPAALLRGIFCQCDQLVDLLVFQRSAINDRLISKRCEPDPDVIVIPFLFFAFSSVSAS